RHRLPSRLVFGEVATPVLRRNQQLADRVAAEHLAAIDADIRLARLRIARHDAAERVDEAAAVEVMPLRSRELGQVHLLAAQDVLLHGARLHLHGLHRVSEDIFQSAHDGRVAGRRGYSEHQADVALVAHARRQELGAPRLLVVLDVLEEQRGAPEREGDPGERADLAVPVHLGLDAPDLSGGIEVGEPGPQAGRLAAGGRVTVGGRLTTRGRLSLHGVRIIHRLRSTPVIAQQIVNGLMLGATYALIGIAFSLILGIFDMLNIAIGEVFMLGAFFGLSLLRAGFPFAAALPVAMALAGLVSLIIERFAIRPLRGTSPVIPLLSSIGFSMILQDVAVNVWGSERTRFPASVAVATWSLGPILVSSIQLVILGTAAAFMAG